MGINKDLGLPFGSGMEKVAICFDVDGTLIYGEYITHGGMLDLLRSFAFQKWKNPDIYVWSGGGAKYAETQYRRITGDLDERAVKFASKMEFGAIKARYDRTIAIDDVQDTRLGDVNLIVRNK